MEIFEKAENLMHYLVCFKAKQLLFSIAVRLKSITITATTPANSGVRFETGTSEIYISNR